MEISGQTAIQQRVGWGDDRLNRSQYHQAAASLQGNYSALPSARQAAGWSNTPRSGHHVLTKTDKPEGVQRTTKKKKKMPKEFGKQKIFVCM